jgi:hypothetical protein
MKLLAEMLYKVINLEPISSALTVLTQVRLTDLIGSWFAKDQDGQPTIHKTEGCV